MEPLRSQHGDNLRYRFHVGQNTETSLLYSVSGDTKEETNMGNLFGTEYGD